MAKDNLEYRQIGNMAPDEIHDTSGEQYGLTSDVPSLAEQWRRQGIGYIETDPVASERFTSDEIKAMGLIGVTLVIPKPE